jgi:DNA polymerase-3 subunit epsilon
MYIFFDTETTGVPRNYKASPKDLNNWPRITQFAFIVTDEKFNIVKTFQALLQPDGWEVPTEKFFIDNNMSTERCKLEGLKAEIVLSEFVKWVNKSDYMVAHNMNFDRPIVTAEMIRYGFSVDKKPIPICTMLSTKRWMNLPRMKWPRLDELHQRCFGFGFDNAHDALADVRATVNCMKYLVENKIIETWTS